MFYKASGIGQGASGIGNKTNPLFPIPYSQYPVPNLSIHIASKYGNAKLQGQELA
ncbi:MAG: hypothetical protein HXY43_14570 [Fischerella sp.]|uniref:hypothetical protein n=1 Tax=Fischerella sp. TaxID=1191 RepID=UPI001793C8C7|nr:hypothetical protein [Fischerella sp.]NWF60442.1 hypothetical protein [Fischerella sp.]